MLWLALTALPFSIKLPTLGSEVMMTAFRLLLSILSTKPKSLAAKVLLPSSKIVTVALEPIGASLTAVIVSPKVTVPLE